MIQLIEIAYILKYFQDLIAKKRPVVLSYKP